MRCRRANGQDRQTRERNMHKTVLTALLTSTVMICVTGTASAQELVTADRIGSADAPKTMTFRVNADQSNSSSHPSQAEGFVGLYQKFAEDIRTGRSTSRSTRQTSGASTPRCLSRRGRAGRRTVRRSIPSSSRSLSSRARSRLSMSISRRRRSTTSSPSSRPASQGPTARLRVVVEHRPPRALSQQGSGAERTADLG